MQEGVGSRERSVAVIGGERDDDESSGPSANFASSWENVDEKEIDTKVTIAISFETNKQNQQKFTRQSE